MLCHTSTEAITAIEMIVEYLRRDTLSAQYSLTYEYLDIVKAEFHALNCINLQYFFGQLI